MAGRTHEFAIAASAPPTSATEAVRLRRAGTPCQKSVTRAAHAYAAGPSPARWYPRGHYGSIPVPLATFGIRGSVGGGRPALSNDHFFEFALFRASRAVRRAFDAHLSPLGLNFTEASLLAYVRDSGPVTQRELADHLSIGKASTGTFIDGLERRGLLKRTADATDRRVWKISLTVAGTKLLETFDQVEADLRAALRQGISRQERLLLIELLDRLEANSNASVNGDLTEVKEA